MHPALHGTGRPCLTTKATEPTHNRPTTHNPTMQQRNTKKHWLALSLVRYYHNTSEAARVRDLWPLVSEFYERPDNLVSQLGELKNRDELVDHLVTKSPGRKGDRKVFAYYPTEELAERLRGMGEPSYLPDGSPIPESLDPSLPDENTHPDDPENVTCTINDDETGLRYHNKETGDGPSKRRYSSTDRRRDPDITPDERDDEDDDTDESSSDDPDHAPDDKPLSDRSEEAENNLIDYDTLPSADSAVSLHLPLTDGSTPVPGDHVGDVDWNRIASRLERKADSLHDAGFTEVATAYSQFATLAVEGTLDKRTAFVLQGVPVLEFETQAAAEDIHD